MFSCSPRFFFFAWVFVFSGRRAQVSARTACEEAREAQAFQVDNENVLSITVFTKFGFVVIEPIACDACVAYYSMNRTDVFS